MVERNNSIKLKKLFPYILVGIAIIYFAFYFYVKYSGAEKGETAPDFEAELIDGSSFKLSDLKDKYVLLDFWASWCGACRTENQKLVELHYKHSDKIIIVTVALEKSENAWKDAAKTDGFVWKHQIVENVNFLLLSDIARKYGVSEIPKKFLISPEGKILPNSSFEEIDALLSSLK